MATDDFFRAQLDQLIDLRHTLAVLSTRMPGSEIDVSLAPLFARRAHAGHDTAILAARRAVYE